MVKDEMPNWPMDELNGGRAHTHTGEAIEKQLRTSELQGNLSQTHRA